MGWSFPLGRLFGSEVRVHATFFLLLAWIGGAAWLTGGPAAAAANVAFVLALFACVLAHEYGHALMARRYGIATPDITLLPIGGLARLERLPEEPGREIAVALAGPAVNVVIAAVLLALGANPMAGAGVEDAGAGFLDRLAAVNIFLVLFNMIPAFPMDGGRVLRAVLAAGLGRARATRLAALAGQTVAFGFAILGLLSGNVILVIIAVFIWFAAGSESADTALREAARGLMARDAMITAFEALRSDDTLDAAATALIRTTQHEFPVVDGSGTLAGFLTRAALLRALAEGSRATPVAAAMDADVPTVPLGARLDAAMDAMNRARAPAVGVTDRDGRLLGYITPENLGELMLVRRKA
ncbi:MAG: site-2 protease family protein [Gemmobacter sp.]